QREIVVHPHRLDPPAAAEVEAASRLVGEGGNRNAILKRDAAAADGFDAERGCQFGRGRRAGTGRKQKPEEQRSQDQTGAVAGRAQRTELWRESVRPVPTFWTPSAQRGAARPPRCRAGAPPSPPERTPPRRARELSL